MLLIWLKKQIMALKLQKLKINLITITMINILLLQANLVMKTNFDKAISRLNSKITENKTKNGAIENELIKLKAH